jgi:hypothetical protein
VGKSSHGATNRSEGHLRAPRTAGQGSTGPQTAAKGTFGRHELRGRVPTGATNHGEGHLRAPRTAGQGSNRERPTAGPLARTRPSGRKHTGMGFTGTRRSRPGPDESPRRPAGTDRNDALGRRTTRPTATRQGPRTPTTRGANPATALGQPTGRQAEASPSGPAQARTHPSHTSDAKSPRPSGRNETATESRGQSQRDPRVTKGPARRPVPARPSGHKGASPQASPGAIQVTTGPATGQSPRDLRVTKGPATGQSPRDLRVTKGPARRAVPARPSGHKGTSQQRQSSERRRDEASRARLGNKPKGASGGSSAATLSGLQRTSRRTKTLRSSDRQMDAGTNVATRADPRPETGNNGERAAERGDAQRAVAEGKAS